MELLLDHKFPHLTTPGLMDYLLNPFMSTKHQDFQVSIHQIFKNKY